MASPDQTHQRGQAREIPPRNVLVVGLGGMGASLASRISDAGHGVWAVDRSPEAQRRWTERNGLPAFLHPRDVPTSEVDAVVVAVRTPDQAASVLNELVGWSPVDGAPWFVVTTLDAPTARGLNGYRERGARVIEAPVSGGEQAAEEGTLTVILAGPVTDDDVAFLTSTVARTTVLFDGYGQPTVAKLINNVTGAFNLVVAAEMLRLGESLGVPAARMHDVLSASSGASWMASAMPHLRADLLRKDVELLARAVSLPEPSLADPDVIPDLLSDALSRIEADGE